MRNHAKPCARGIEKDAIEVGAHLANKAISSFPNGSNDLWVFPAIHACDDAICHAHAVVICHQGLSCSSSKACEFYTQKRQ